MTHLMKMIFLHRVKDQKNNFSPVLHKRPFDHRKESLKTANSTSKVSTSNLL